jgi:cellulose synthase/poly-beta-1,6-N-acetylglucosamine synthase-like glycosyltransferase
MFSDVLIAVAILYALQTLFFTVAALLAKYPFDRGYKPSVSIIVAARNEEHRIGPCLESLARLTYVGGAFEIIIVNDNSTDATAAIVRQFCLDHPNIKMVETGNVSGTLRGKPNALAHGVDASNGEILLFTDADCTAPAGWIEHTVKYYSDSSVGLVGGFTSIRWSTWFEAIQALDWFLLFSVAAALMRIGLPVTAVGTNLSVRRKAYDAVGGFRRVPFSVTEDYALVNAIASRTSFKAIFPMDKECLVESLPCKTWRELFRQKLRWFTGGKSIEFRKKLVFVVAYALNALIMISPITRETAIAGGVALAVKTLVDLILTVPAIASFDKWGLLKMCVPFQAYYVLYVLFFPVAVFFKQKVVWKNRTL